MKTLIFLTIICFSTPVIVHAQAEETQQLILNVQKLAQLKSILQNMYDGYKVVSNGYNNIKNISQGNYSLHQAFLDRMLEVSPAVKKYKRIADIIAYQKIIMQEHKLAFKYFLGSGSFSADELNYMKGVYSNLFAQGKKSLDDLLMVVTASRLRMSDDERLAAIDKIFNDMEDKLSFLCSFNNSTKMLAVQRSKVQVEIDMMKALRGIE